MLQEEQIKYFKLPFGKNKQETLVISVLDSSGSMRQVWPTLADCYNRYIVDLTKNYYNTCFDTKCYDVGKRKLSEKLNDYGGGGTHITQAFQNLNFLLKKYKNMPITVIFVSDGQGDTNGLDKINPGQLPFLNFICVGVGKGFPTFTAMKLREIFHNGDNQVPQVFLIDMEAGFEKEFHEKFQMIQKYIQCRQIFKTSPCLQYPWEREFLENFPAETWVASFDDEIICEGNKIQPTKIFIQELLEISKFWLQNLQAESLKQDVSQKATEAVKEITKLFEYAYPQKQANRKLKKLTFAARLKERLNMCDTLEESEFNHIVQQINNLKQKDYLKNLTEAEAAKRLAIGTQAGHFLDKAIKWRGLSVEAFKLDRDELANILNNNYFVQNQNMKSVITMQNQKEILLEQDFIQGLQLCPSQYDLVPSLPLIGYAVEVYLSSASDINSWLVQVRNVARFNKYVDTLTVQQAGKNRVRLNTGGDDYEEVNCVLPLISANEDKDLIPFYKSRIFHSLMTFNLIKNIDQCDTTAHGALLANTYLHLIQLERSEFRDQMIDMVKNTFDLCYKDDLQSFYTLLKEKPQFALMVEHPTKKYDTKCEDPSKALIVLEIIKDQLTPQELENIVERIIIEIIGRCNKYSVENFILYTNLKNYEQIWKDIIIKIYTEKGKLGLKQIPKEEKFPFQQSVLEAVTNELKKQEIVLNKQHFKNIGNFRYEPNVINSICKHFLNRNVDIEFIFACLYHSRNKTPKLRAKNEFERDVQKILDGAIKEHIFNVIQYTFDKACHDKSDYISCVRLLYEGY